MDDLLNAELAVWDARDRIREAHGIFMRRFASGEDCRASLDLANRCSFILQHIQDLADAIEPAALKIATEGYRHAVTR